MRDEQAVGDESMALPAQPQATPVIRPTRTIWMTRTGGYLRILITGVVIVLMLYVLILDIAGMLG